MRRDEFRFSKGRLSAEKIEASKLLVEQRGVTRGQLNCALNPELPIAEGAAEIEAALRDHQVVVVAGETGSGKTTQLPKICLQLGYGQRGWIGHTQPRRLAARTVAARIDEELGRVPDSVGHAVRFSDTVAEGTLVKVMTDGLLLTEIRRDRFLENYEVLIIDEAHERSLNIDFLLGYVRRLLARRQDLKVVITSATIDVERMSEFFGDAPIVSVGGRTYPVEVVYLDEPVDLVSGICDALDDIQTRPYQGASDVLAFFSGEREIFEVSKELRKHYGQRWEVLPLYARLSYSEQQKVFRTSSAKRRIVLATNVAETSLTVPNIGFVIDPGFARINRYSYKSKLERLPIEPVARASADQRKGRCGRIAPGVCFRLYDEQDYLSRPEFADPEIRRVNLASVVLQMHAFGLGEIQTFPFIDPPDPRAVKDAIRLLSELEALRGDKLTKIGQHMAALPVDPRLARMLVEANQQGCLREVSIIVAGLAVQDPRERPLQAQQAADQAHQQFADPNSDFLAWLNLWDWLEETRQANTRNGFNRVLAKHFVSPLRVREWREVHRQLRQVCRDLKFRENSERASYGAIHEAILAGSLSLIALHDEKGNYLGPRNLKLRLFPGSGVEKSPKWVVAAEIAETSRVYARSVAKVEARWIERRAGHLVKKQVSEPGWHLKRGEAVARQRVLLYGLTLAENRLVSLVHEDPDLAREFFLRDGLVAGAIENPPPFLTKNIQAVARVRDLEAKGRRRDLLVDDAELVAFYASRIPADVVRVKDLRAWLRKADESELLMSEAFLTRQTDVSLTETAFPSRLEFGEVSLPLKYRFAPGEVNDGVTLIVPVGLLPLLSAERLEWFVPGFFAPLIEQLLRSLPKTKRKTLVPLPEKASELARHLTHVDRFGDGRLVGALEALLRDWYRVDVSVSDWDKSRVEQRLKFFVEVVDDQKKVLARGREINEIKDKLLGGEEPGEQIEEAHSSSGEPLKEFPTSALQDTVVVGRGAARKVKYPALVDAGEHVALQLFDSKAKQAEAHRGGLIRLASFNLGPARRYFRKELDKHRELGLLFAPLGNAEAMKAEILNNVLWYCYFDGMPWPANQAEFDSRMEDKRPQLAEVFQKTLDTFAEVVRLRHEVITACDKLTGVAFAASCEDVKVCVEEITGGGVLTNTPFVYLGLLPRYLEGLQYRLANLSGRVPKDQTLMAGVQPLEARWREISTHELAEADRVQALRFLLMEMRLQLFAEPVAKRKVEAHGLDTSYLGGQWKASTKRVEQALHEEERRIGLA